jgi:hypothetical protein
LNRWFSKEQVQMANGHVKTRSALLAVNKMKMKMALGLHLTPIRMASPGKHQQMLAQMQGRGGLGEGRGGTLYPADGNIN